MAHLFPFKGLRPPVELVQTLVVPPYDVVNREEATAYAKGNPQSFFRVSRPEVALPPEIGEHDPRVYALGKTALDELISQGWLVREKEPIFYAYRQKMGRHTQLGLVAAASVDEYDRGLIKKHELTRPDKEDDRTAHIAALDANDEPVFLTYRADPAIDGLLAAAVKKAPVYDFITEDQISHTVWTLTGPESAQVGRAFEKVPFLYIADGHHRSAAASRVARRHREAGRGEGGHQRFLAVVFPHDQMQILDYNRVVKDLHGLGTDAFLAKLKERFIVEKGTSQKPASLHQFGMYLAKTWYRLTAKPGTYPDTPLGVLDVSILQNNLLAPVLGIGDPRTDGRLSFVGGIRGTAELEKLVDSGKFEVAFSMYPTTLEQLMAIADAGEIMPPKSTWFEPKLRSGLVLHPFT